MQLFAWQFQVCWRGYWGVSFKAACGVSEIGLPVTVLGLQVNSCSDSSFEAAGETISGAVLWLLVR